MKVIMSKILISHKRVLIKCPDTPRGTELCYNTKLHFIHHLFFKHCINEPAHWIYESSQISYITGNRESYKESQSCLAREGDDLANLLGSYGESKACYSLWQDLQPI